MKPRNTFRTASALATMTLALAALAVAPVALAADPEITIVDFDYEPKQATAFVGQPVTWTNGGERTHTVTSDQGTELDSGNLDSGEAFGHVFEAPGTYPYHCTIHGDAMSGTITVEAAPVTPVPTGDPTPVPPAGTLPPNFSPFPDPPTLTPTERPAATGTTAATATPVPDPDQGNAGEVGALIAVAVAVVAALGAAMLAISRRRRA